MYQNNQYSLTYKPFQNNPNLEERLTYKTIGCSDYSAAIKRDEPEVVYILGNNSINSSGVEGVLSYHSNSVGNNSIDSFFEKNTPWYSLESPGKINNYIHSGMKLPFEDPYLQRAINTNYISHPDFFVKQHCPVRFVNSNDEVQELVEEAFFKVTGRMLSNINIKICEEEEMKRLHPDWHPGILGFSLNLGVGNMVFAKKESIEKLLITIGHEIGHVLTPVLSDTVTEEAKAFAFEFAWVKAIKEHDIGNLGNFLRQDLPAENGLHDTAFGFVLCKLKEGGDPLELHESICKSIVKVVNLADY
ncbi:MAG: hypothetical protein ACOCZ6_05430 [Nanoarchaeota archaeon]